MNGGVAVERRPPQPWWLFLLMLAALTTTQLLAFSHWNTPYEGTCPNELIRPLGVLYLLCSWVTLLLGLVAGQRWDRRHGDVRRRWPAEAFLVIPALGMPAIMFAGILLCGL